MRILLAGVPFGCENVGDEAILACALGIFQKAAPEAEFTVSTADPERTAIRLNVAACGLLGFFGDVSQEETLKIIDSHDWFVWCGATGLSDYPHVTTELMKIAQSRGKKTLLWCVGMNDELSPAFNRVRSGRRYNLLRFLQFCCLGLVDTIAWEEGRRVRNSRAMIADCLNAADGLFVRDVQSREEVLRSGVHREVTVGADSAIRLRPSLFDEIDLAPGIRSELESDQPKIGLCISAQGAVQDELALAAFLDELIEATGARIVGIPMNPLTDSALMARLAARMSHRSSISIITGEYQPEEILCIASRMDLIISSRLHLLILASIVHVPIAGISRGSKVDNFLSQFDLTSGGTVESCDFNALRDDVLRLLKQPSEFKEKSLTVYRESIARLDAAEEKLAKLLGS